MGEGRMRRVVACSLVMLLVFLIPVSAEESESVRLNIEIADDNAKPWYGTGERVLLSSSIVNDGGATSISEDPSCGTVMIVSDAKGDVVIDERTACRGQSRGLDVGPGTTALDQHQWDLTNQNGELVSPGVYTITIELAGSELSSSTDITVQQNANLPNGLTFSTSLTHRNSVLSLGEPFVLTYQLHNPTNEAIDIESLDACHLLVEFEQPLLGPSCNANKATIEPYAVVALGHTLLQPSTVGETTLSVYTPDGITIDTYQLLVQERMVQPNSLEASINTVSNSFVQGELLDASITVSNAGSEDELLRFTNTCRASYWVADANGNVVFDSLDRANCRDTELDVVVAASSQSTFPLQTWAFVDDVGCSMLSGHYVLVAELSEFNYIASENLDYRRVQSDDCGTSAAPSPSMTVQVDDNNVPAFEIKLTGTAEQTEIQWLEVCKASIQLWNLDLMEKVIEKNVLCNGDERIDQALRIASGDVLSFQISDLNDYDYQEAQYRVRIDFAADQDVVLEQEFQWPIEEVEQEDAVVEETEINNPIIRIEGVWNNVVTPDGTCWMLEDNAGTSHMLANSAIDLWAPERGTSGVYEAQQQNPTQACARFTAQSYTLIGVLAETPLVADSVVVEDSTVVDVEQPASETLPEWAPQAVTVLTVSAILSLLGFAAFNNEAIRISTTLTGLWLLGLVGRTSETSDGRFQRGRLLGYLTANPGCHFRALLSALEMSNGQLSHHLRVLEQEEAIWRRKDGRFVRYYPLTNTLHPLMEDDSLPVPILAPDPLSLQGKILLLLDHDGQMGDFPSQAELAKRLDKSQQLISHHLRTLEKYGLIEGRRMGMRNRYKLTKEAMFLLETNDAYIKNEMTF